MGGGWAVAEAALLTLGFPVQLAETLDGVSIHCDQPLVHQAQEKQMQHSWTFTIHSEVRGQPGPESVSWGLGPGALPCAASPMSDLEVWREPLGLLRGVSLLVPGWSPLSALHSTIAVQCP